MKRINMFFSPDDGGLGAGAGTLVSGAPEGGAAPEWTGFTNADGAFNEGWTAKLPDELGEARESFGRFKTVAELAKSYKGLEEKLGSKANMVTVPTKDSKPEDWAAFRKAVGAPEKPEDYHIKPDKLPDGLEWDDKQVAGALEIAHKHGIPEAAMKDFMGWFAQREEMRGQILEQGVKAQLEAGEKQLREDWGKDYDANLVLAARAAQSIGEDPKTLVGFTDARTVKAFVELAKKLDDDKFVKGGGDGGSSDDPAAEAKDIQTNKENPLYQKYRDKDPETVAKVRELNARAAAIK